MIINLSSNGETNHANFINQFTDNIVIKPNSKICLTRVSLVRDGKQTKITIPAFTTMTFRYTPYDLLKKILNEAETIYTAETLTNRLNVLFGGLKSFNYTFKARVTDTGENIEIEFVSYLDNESWENTVLVDYLFTNGDKARKMTAKACQQFLGTTIPTGTVNSDDEIRSVLWDVVDNNSGFVAGWGSNFTPITSQPNKNAFNMYCSGGDKYGSSYFTVVNPTFLGSQEIRIGPATFDDATNNYSVAPMAGNLSNANWFFSLYMGPSNNTELQGGMVYASMRNNETEQNEIVDNGFNWHCGDTFEIYVDTVVPTGNETSDQLFTFNCKCHSRDGLIGYIPSGLSGSKFWNVEAPAYMSPADYWMKYGDDINSLTTFWDGAKMYGSRLGRGIRDTQIIKENVQYLTSIAVGSTTPIEYSSVAAGLRGVGKFPFYRAYTASSPVSNVVDIGAHLTIGAGLPIKNVPTLFTFIFQLQDKSAFTANTIRLLVAGFNEKIIKIDTAAVAYDLQLMEVDGTAHSVNLVDGATRITFNNVSNYFFSLKSYGFSTNQRVDITVTDLATSVDYIGSVTMSGSGMDDIAFLGGDPSGTNNEDYLHGHLGEFRFYQRPVDVTGSIAYWNNKVGFLKTYYDGSGLVESEKAYFGATNLKNVYSASNPKYGNYGTSSSTNTMTPCIMRAGGERGIVYDTNGYNFSDIFFFPQMTMPDADRYVVDTNVNSSSLTGMGIVSSAALNTILDIKDYDTTTDVVLQTQQTGASQNTIDNPIFSTTSGIEQVDIDDKIFNIQIKNLPHRNYNGAISNFDKTIYQIGSLVNGKTIEDKRIIEVYPPVKVFTELENAGDIILNQLEVMITDELNIVETDLKANTNVTIEIL